MPFPTTAQGFALRITSYKNTYVVKCSEKCCTNAVKGQKYFCRASSLVALCLRAWPRCPCSGRICSSHQMVSNTKPSGKSSFDRLSRLLITTPVAAGTVVPWRTLIGTNNSGLTLATSGKHEACQGGISRECYLANPAPSQGNEAPGLFNKVLLFCTLSFCTVLFISIRIKYYVTHTGKNKPCSEY